MIDNQDLISGRDGNEFSSVPPHSNSYQRPLSFLFNG